MNAGPEKKINVLFLTKWYPNADDPQLGVFIRKHAEAAALFDRVSLVYIAPRNPSMHHPDLYVQDHMQVRQHFLYYHKSSFTWVNGLRYWLKTEAAWRAIVKNSGRPDVIHCHVLTKPVFMAWWYQLRHGVPFIITEHWTGYSSGKFRLKPFWYRWITRQLARRAQMIVVVSESLKKSLISNGIRNNFKVIPNVVDLPELSMPTNREKIHFVTVADLIDEQKNISATIQVSSRLAKEGLEFEFHIIGGGPDESRLKMLAKESGILDSVVFFHGRQPNEEVYNQLRHADFVVVNSNTETFSVVTAEALASGKPVIATRCGGPEEILEPGTGLIIEKGDEPGLENAIRTMLKNSRRYNPAELQKVVSGRYSRGTIGKQFHDLYVSIVSKSLTRQ